jgi:diaminopimelate epimerase
MEFDFCKMHGAGNDFLLINDMDERCLISKASIAALCSRHRGIGADGLILLRPSAAARFSMKYFNSDGGEAQMCGNGARCAAKFAHECGIAERVMSFETRVGMVRAEILKEGVRIDIGDVRELALDKRIASYARPVHFGVCGVPHAVIVDDGAGSLPHEEFVAFARKVRHDPAFGADGANVNAVSVIGKHRCTYRTYERGVEDETLACGTGAVVVSAVLLHLAAVEPPVVCETRGGDALEVACTRTAGGATDCRLKGPVAVSFHGSFRAEDYMRP